MRVAYVSLDPGVPIFGSKGCSIHVQEMVRFLRSVGGEVTVFSPRVGGPAAADLESVAVVELAVDARSLRDREIGTIALNDALQTKLNQSGPYNVIYERHSLFSYAGMHYARENRIAGILEVNAPLIEEQERHRELIRTAYARRTTRMALQAASTVVAVSGPVRNYVLAFTPDHPGVHVIPNGVDVKRFRPHAEDRADTKNDFTIGFVGSLKTWHGVEHLFEAFRQVRDDIEEASLLVVGDGPERRNLEHLAARLGVSPQVRFAGRVAHEQVPGLLASMDVAVAPYPQTDSNYFSPLKIFEYMAAGVPVVATRSGQVAEIIEDRVTGLLATPGDSTAIAKAIVSLSDDPDLAARLAAKAREHVVANHTWHSVGMRTLEAAGLESAVLETAA